MITKEKLTEWVWDVFDCVRNGGNNRQYFITRGVDKDGFWDDNIYFWDWYVGTDLDLNLDKEEDGQVYWHTATTTFSDIQMVLNNNKYYPNNDTEYYYYENIDKLLEDAEKIPPSEIPAEVKLLREVAQEVAKKIRVGR